MIKAKKGIVELKFNEKSDIIEIWVAGFIVREMKSLEARDLTEALLDLMDKVKEKYKLDK